MDMTETESQSSMGMAMAMDDFFAGCRVSLRDSLIIERHIGGHIQQSLIL